MKNIKAETDNVFFLNVYYISAGQTSLLQVQNVVHVQKNHSTLCRFLPLYSSFKNDVIHTIRYKQVKFSVLEAHAGNIIKKRLIAFAFEKTPHNSLSWKLVPVIY